MVDTQRGMENAAGYGVPMMTAARFSTSWLKAAIEPNEVRQFLCGDLADNFITPASAWQPANPLCRRSERSKSLYCPLVPDLINDGQLTMTVRG